MTKLFWTFVFVGVAFISLGTLTGCSSVGIKGDPYASVTTSDGNAIAWSFTPNREQIARFKYHAVSLKNGS